MPETPIWLLSRGRHEDALRSLCWLRGWTTPDDVREEFNQLVKYDNDVNKENLTTTAKTNEVTDENKHMAYAKCSNEREASKGDDEIQEDTQQSQTQDYNPKPHNFLKTDKGVPHSWLVRCKGLLKPPTLRPLALVVTFFSVLHFGGITSMRPFMIHVFHLLGMKDEASWITVGLAGVSILGSTCTVVTVKWLGKRFLTLASTCPCAVAYLLLGVYSYVVLGPGGASDYARTWMPLTLMTVIFFFNSVIGQIPWMLLCEVFPFRTRAIASGLASALCYAFIFTASKSYLHLEQSLELHGVFWLFCVINCVGFAFLYRKMPETEGKSLAEIEIYFSS
ncbi:putative polyol transporter 6 [Zootermopsis nevadensis]|uniref:Putative polyol transporter 6 n=2 Tax=Zootermopsis nevadensis TaxID=136037 RepID=A0A067QKZ6_ZOONE|nr:putative polyol transporter 6 [Zootermopsis nevadensis]